MGNNHSTRKVVAAVAYAASRQNLILHTARNWFTIWLPQYFPILLPSILVGFFAFGIPIIMFRRESANDDIIKRCIPKNKWSLSSEIWFDIFAFVKLHDSPNLFLLNRNLRPICQEYFYSGSVEKRRRIVRDLMLIYEKDTMELLRRHLGNNILENKDLWGKSPGDFLRIFSRGTNNHLRLLPIPHVDAPSIFKCFGQVQIAPCCRIPAMQFLSKFQSLLSAEYNIVLCERDFLRTDVWQKQKEAFEQQKQAFLNLLEQKQIWLRLNGCKESSGVARVLIEPLIAPFNGQFCMAFVEAENLSSREGEDAKLIYGWISGPKNGDGRNVLLHLFYYDAAKALELLGEILKLFEQAHIDKAEATNQMSLIISLYNEFDQQQPVPPMHVQKICNAKGKHLATVRTILLHSMENEGSTMPAYVFFTKCSEYFSENTESLELFKQKVVYFMDS